jgi:hypothetical protein
VEDLAGIVDDDAKDKRQMPHPVTAALLSALVYCSGMTVMVGAPIENSLPSRLLASVEGFDGPSYRVEIVDAAHVAYFSNPRGFTVWEGTKRIVLKIPRGAWTRFRLRLDAAHVWNWKPEYINRRVADGTVWKLEVEYRDRHLSGHGSNAYPVRRQFEEFCAAIRELIGEKAFK